MTINEVTTLISGLGFPIVACIYMYKLNVKYISQLTETMNELKETILESLHK